MEPADVDYFRKNQSDFFLMVKEQGPEFWTYFLLTFRGYVLAEILPKMPDSFVVGEGDKAVLILDGGLADIYKKWIVGNLRER